MLVGLTVYLLVHTSMVAVSSHPTSSAPPEDVLSTGIPIDLAFWSPREATIALMAGTVG